MDGTTTKAARLQALRDRWMTEPLGVDFPELDGLPAPSTCNELVRSERITSAFSSLADAPEVAGLTPDAALQADRSANTTRYGIEDPKALLADLSTQFDAAPAAPVDPEVIKKAFVLLQELRTDSTRLAASLDPDTTATHLAEASAIGKAQQVVSDLAAELGISLPINRGVNPGGKV
jgi:hypothetical protein